MPITSLRTGIITAVSAVALLALGACERPAVISSGSDSPATTEATQSPQASPNRAENVPAADPEDSETTEDSEKSDSADTEQTEDAADEAASLTPTESAAKSAAPSRSLEQRTELKSNTAATTSSPATTGVPAGTKLTRHNGDLVITERGKVIDGLEVYGSITVRAADVTIRNTRVVGTKTVTTGLIGSQSTGLKVIDSEIRSDHRNPTTNGVMGSNFELVRVEIRDVVDQVHVHGAGNVTVRDSWLHSNVHYAKDPNWGGGPSHDDNIQIVSGKNITLTGNRLEGAWNAAVMITQDAGAAGSISIRNNLIADGGCSVNVSPGSRGTVSGLAITGNSFDRGQRHTGCAIIAPASYANGVSSNIWADTGAAVRMSRG